MGNTAPTQPLSPTLSDDKSVLLPVPSSLNSPHCDSLQSMTFHHPYASTPSGHSDAQTAFPFQSAMMPQISDCWNSYNVQKFGLNASPEMSHTIHRLSPSHINSEWMSVFGTQIIRKGDFKTWKLKIYPRHDAIQYIIKHREYPIADLVIGVADVDSVRSDNRRYNNYKGPFWRNPFTGYGYYGLNGKKLHQKRKGKAYSQTFKVSDVITIELDLIQCNELKFYVNGISHGVSFNVDGNRDYVLALAFCDNNYDVQIRSGS